MLTSTISDMRRSLEYWVGYRSTAAQYSQYNKLREHPVFDDLVRNLRRAVDLVHRPERVFIKKVVLFRFNASFFMETYV